MSGGSTVYSTVRLYHDVLGDNPADNSTNRADDVEVTTVSVTGTDHVFINNRCCRRIILCRSSR